MAYDEKLAQRVREYLADARVTNVVEKLMFGGLAFLVNEKMCVNVNGERLMCRFDAKHHNRLASLPGFLDFYMSGRLIRGYCYVAPDAITTKASLKFWVDECLAFNHKAESSKKQV